MNKLKTYNDGSYMPLWQKDLEFIQEAFHEPFEKLCETLLGKSSGIIFGCKLGGKGGSTTITEGLVLIDSEIIYCPAQTVSGNANVLQKQDAYDTDGDKVFKVSSGTEVRQTYYKPYAKLTTGFSIGGLSGAGEKYLTLDDQGKKTLVECLYEKVFSMFLQTPHSEEYTTLYERIRESLLAEKYALGGNGDQSGSMGAITRIFYTKIGKCVHILSLDWSVGTSAGGGNGTARNFNRNITLNIPSVHQPDAEYRPKVDTYFTYYVNPTREVYIGKMTSAGEILIADDKESITALAFSYLTA
jgi:hypothetical protein